MNAVFLSFLPCLPMFENSLTPIETVAGHRQVPYFLVETVKNLLALRSVFKYQIG